MGSNVNVPAVIVDDIVAVEACVAVVDDSVADVAPVVDDAVESCVAVVDGSVAAVVLDGCVSVVDDVVETSVSVALVVDDVSVHACTWWSFLHAHGHSSAL